MKAIQPEFGVRRRGVRRRGVALSGRLRQQSMRFAQATPTEFGFFPLRILLLIAGGVRQRENTIL
ncbi:MAG TPA: hypothetical protein DDW51_02720 [Cyanobacteria bacterium UBA11367]|nr:hypothetical protein [Cyanobacteria bacterium UBA11367]